MSAIWLSIIITLMSAFTVLSGSVMGNMTGELKEETVMSETTAVLTETKAQEIKQPEMTVKRKEPAATTTTIVTTTAAAPETEKTTEADHSAKDVPSAETGIRVIRSTFNIQEDAIIRGFGEGTPRDYTMTTQRMPVFRLESKADAAHLSELFPNDKKGSSGRTLLAEALQEYSEAFFADQVLYAVYMESGTSSYHPEEFVVETRLSNRCLHICIRIERPSNVAMTADMSGYWILVPQERAAAESLIAWDAGSKYCEFTDWTEPINPNWR